MKKAFRFRVILDTEEDVVRELEIFEEDSFESLHKILLASFGFSATEMASFYMSNNEWEKGEEITLMNIGSIDEMEEEAGILSAPMMSNCYLYEYMNGPESKMIYVFDFLLMWCFYIELIEEFESEDKDLPLCSKEMGKAPKQGDKDPDEMLLGDAVADETSDIMAGFEEDDDESIIDPNQE